MAANVHPTRRRELVLVGGGHSHVQVLRRFAMEPPPDTRLTVVLDTPIAVYSGMVPGFVAGQYRASELEIDVVPLARRARARVVLAPAVAVDAAARRIEVAGRPPIPYDVAAFDVGSTVAGLDLPGVREHAVPTRPIARFVERVDGLLGELSGRGGERPFRVVVVGGGAGGVEVAFALRHRLAAAGTAPAVTLVDSAPEILRGYGSGVVGRVRRAARREGIEIVTGRRVTAVEAGAVVLDGGDSGDGDQLPYDSLLWVTGAVSQPLFRDSGLATDDRGFVLTRPTLQVEGYDDLFATGDCATLAADPATPKAGVYAVRQGPYLVDNLRAALAGRRLRRYRPQSDFLTLLNLGDGTAVGTKWGVAFEGRWVMKLKDWIDRRFMRRFQVLGDGGAPTPEFPEMAGMEVLCGGCAAKVGQSVLERALGRLGPPLDDPTVVLGLDRPDDAAAVRTPGGDVVVSTVDAFRAFTDDPFLVGQVAAVNALSDLWAQGVEPRHALALAALPEELEPEAVEEALYQLLAGVRAACDPLGVTLIGGHTTTAPELLVGLTVDGVAAPGDALLTKGGLRPGQRLILTKALGTGAIFHADMKGLARGPWVASAVDSMLRPNRGAADAARRAGAAAATDVTGFGLAGHLGEMVRASGVAATVELGSLPALPGAVELLGRGVRSTFHPENRRALRGLAVRPEAARHPRLELLFDPQTSGGLLFGVDDHRADDALRRLHDAGDPSAAAIGRVTEPRDDGAPIEVVLGL